MLNIKRMFFLGMAALLVLPASAIASREARPIATDPRIKVIMYSPNEVFKFTGFLGFQSSIEFAPDEEIGTISVGNSISWMLNPSGNRLFLKPIEPDATTNMTLITNKRTYLFELHASTTEEITDKNLTFQLRFVYPGEETEIVNTGPESGLPDIENEPEKYNFRYSIQGSDFIAPIRIFDDGRFTYFEFRNKNAEVPAFFSVDAQGNESIINYRARGDYIIVERVSGRMTLRHGGDVVCVFNEAMPYLVAPAAKGAPASEKPELYPNTSPVGSK